MSKEHRREEPIRNSRWQKDGSEASDTEIRSVTEAQDLEQAHQHASARIRSYPAITHAVFVSLILIPIAALPYIASRPRFHELKRQIRALHLDNRALKLELDSALERQRVTYESKIRELELVNARISEDVRNLRHVMDQQNADGKKFAKDLGTDVQRALEETRQSRTRQGEMLHGLGATLADIAKFMQEVEMKFGMDQAAPEKVRKAAAQFQNTSKQLGPESVHEDRPHSDYTNDRS